MYYQGRDGKYYTIQKVSFIISGFTSVLVVGIAKRISETEWSKSKIFALFIFLWLLTFVAHYAWFLNQRNNYSFIHYKEYKKYLWFFLFLIVLSILSHFPF